MDKVQNQRNEINNLHKQLKAKKEIIEKLSYDLLELEQELSNYKIVSNISEIHLIVTKQDKSEVVLQLNRDCLDYLLENSKIKKELEVWLS